MRRSLTLLLLVLALGLAYLLLWPIAAKPVAWASKPSPGYTGAHASNNGLTGLSQLDLGSHLGPEHIVARNGWLYAAVASGAIVRLRPDGTEREVLVQTGGRPLGFDFDAAGAMVIADPMAGEHGGLYRTTGSGSSVKIDLLTNSVNGSPILYPDGVVVAQSGKIYFTDASQRFAAKTWGGTFNASVLDILEHQATGRLLEYDPASKTTRVLLSDLCFPNGVALSADERHVFVAETGEYRIWKVAVSAIDVSARQPNANATVLFDNLPGYPDNLMRGQAGRVWVGLVKPRGAFIDKTADKPWLRALSLRLPKALWPVPPAYGHVFAFDEAGKVVTDLQDPTGAYPETTSVTETDDRLYIQSLHAKSLGWLDKKKAGL